MKPGKVRPLALCVFLHDGKILVTEYYDALKQQVFYRPLGGGIRFGEYGRETIVREIGEERGAEVANLRYLGTIENIFVYNGEPGHEIVLMYRGEFLDQALYERDEIPAHDDGSPLKVVWRPLADFQDGQIPLYPTGLLELLGQPKSKSHG